MTLTQMNFYQKYGKDKKKTARKFEITILILSTNI